MSIIQRFARFFMLVFWELPMQREQNPVRRQFNRGIWMIPALFGIGILFRGLPEISPDQYPALDQAAVVEGIAVRQPGYPTTGRHYTGGEPVGIDTGHGIVYAACSKQGLNCLSTDHWKPIEGHRAKMWHWNGWLIQLEADGHIVAGRSYAEIRTWKTSYGPAIWLAWLGF